MTAGYDPKLEVVATALRDLSVALALFEAGQTPERQERLQRKEEYAEKVLAQVVEWEGDLYPRYLAAHSAAKRKHPLTPSEAMAMIYLWGRYDGQEIRVLPEVLSGTLGLHFQALKDGKVTDTLDYFGGEGFSRYE